MSMQVEALKLINNSDVGKQRDDRDGQLHCVGIQKRCLVEEFYDGTPHIHDEESRDNITLHYFHAALRRSPVGAQ